MIVDRYEPVNRFALIPARYATLEPALQELDRLLDDDAIFQQVKRDLAQRYPQILTKGRHSTHSRIASFFGYFAPKTGPKAGLRRP